MSHGRIYRIYRSWHRVSGPGSGKGENSDQSKIVSTEGFTPFACAHRALLHHPSMMAAETIQSLGGHFEDLSKRGQFGSGAMWTSLLCRKSTEQHWFLLFSTSLPQANCFTQGHLPA